MKESVNSYDLYTPLPEHTIIEFISGAVDSAMPCHKVVLKQLNTGEITTVEVSFCAIFIGFRPDLHFLDANNRHDGIRATDHEPNFDPISLMKDSQFLASPYALFSRKIAWFKNLCAKCRHLSICERSRKFNIMQRHSLHRSILCSCSSYGKSNGIKTHSDNNNNTNVNSNCDNQIDKDGQLEKKIVATEPKAIRALGLGEDPTKPVDCKTNPIAVDKYTNEVLNVPGLYAIGPLVSDNFIRFIPGGALAITSQLWKHR